MADIVKRDLKDISLGLKRKLAEKAPSDLALATLLLDMSGSMDTNEEGGNRWKILGLAVKGFCKLKGDAYISMVLFNDELEFAQEPTQTPDVTILDRRFPDGGTMMAEAIQQTIRHINLMDSFEKRRIVLVSDGYANNKNAVIEYLEHMEDGIVIDTVGIGECDENLLREIARITGGLYFYCDELKNLGQIMIDLSPERRQLS